MRRKKARQLFIRISDFIIGFLIACVVITLGRMALAHGVDDVVNAHIKEEFIKMDIAQKRAAMSIPDPKRLGQIQDEDWTHKEGSTSHSDNISPAEQSQFIDRPRAGVMKTVDPNESIEEKIVENQAYALYREHYRGAVKRELMDRAHAMGFNPTNDDANEVTARMVDGQAIPYPSSETPRN